MHLPVRDGGDSQTTDRDKVTVQVLTKQGGGYIVRMTVTEGGVETGRGDFPVEEGEGGLRMARELAESMVSFIKAGYPASVLLGSGE